MIKIIQKLFRLFFAEFFDGLNQVQIKIDKQNLKTAMHGACNPINKQGIKIFSQNEEDGILIEILKRLKLKTGYFAEFGVGNGLENNTLVLLALGWRGFWVGNEKLFFTKNNNKKLFFIKEWITLNNIIQIFQKGLKNFNLTQVDVLSIDCDGNDYYFLEKLLQNQYRPQVIIIEYNGKYPPPIRWRQKYEEKFVWQYDDYFGSSLAEIQELLRLFQYTLVCCNFTGANAFFVQNKNLQSFKDIPRNVRNIFYETNPIDLQCCYKVSKKTVISFLQG